MSPRSASVPWRVPRILAVSTEVRIVAIYVTIGFLWIYFSDQVISWLTQDPVRLRFWSTYKGWLFVGVTGALLFWLLRRDFVRLRQAHEHLAQSESKFRNIANNIPGVVYQFRVRTDGSTYFGYVSPRAEELFGLSPDLESPDWELGVRVHPQDRDGFLASIREAVQQRTPWSYEGRLVRADGSIRWFQGVSSPSLLGDEVAYDGVLFDITERKEAENAVRHSEERFRVMAETVPDFIFTFRPDGWSDFVNGRFYEFTGLSAGSAEGFGWMEALPPDDHQRVAQQWELCMQTKRCELEFRLRSREGEYRWFVSRSRPIQDEQGQIVKWFGACTDIHDRKTAEEELKRLNATLEQRVVERTALAEHRASQLQLLAAELTQAEERERHRLARLLHDHLQQLLVAGRIKLTALCHRTSEEGLLTVARQVDELISQALDESRSLTASLSPPVLYDRGLVGGLQWLARQTQENHHLTVDLQAETEAEPVELDTRILLFQAVRELLLNTIKHARTSSASITLHCVEDDRLRLVVADSGVGFNPAELEHAKTLSGFGLFSLRERLELIGGWLEVASAPGQGTQVMIEVPRHRPHAVPTTGGHSAEGTQLALVRAPALRRSDRATSPSDRVRVLLADDHAIMRQGLVGLLREHAEVEIVGEAADGQQAVQMTLVAQPDVILMDVSMPVMSGIEATRRIMEIMPQARVIGLSMHEADDMAAAMRKAGAVGYLRKDAGIEALLAAILLHQDPLVNLLQTE